VKGISVGSGRKPMARRFYRQCFSWVIKGIYSKDFGAGFERVEKQL
jgi:hypothetical protein